MTAAQDLVLSLLGVLVMLLLNAQVIQIFILHIKLRYLYLQSSKKISIKPTNLLEYFLWLMTNTQFCFRSPEQLQNNSQDNSREHRHWWYWDWGFSWRGIWWRKNLCFPEATANQFKTWKFEKQKLMFSICNVNTISEQINLRCLFFLLL